MKTEYRTRTYDTADGSATFGRAYVRRYTLTAPGTAFWESIGETRRFKVFPRMVRARAAAKGLVLRHARAAGIKPRNILLRTE